MRHLLPLPLLFAAGCGGAAAPAPAPKQPEPVADDSAVEDEWSQYGGADYGYGYGVGYGGMGGYDDYGYGNDPYGGGVAYTPPPPVPPNLAGTWLTACVPGWTSGEHVIMTFANTDARWDLTFAAYGDDKCTTRKSLLHVGGAYTIGVESTASPGAWEGNFAIETLELTADDKKSAKALGKTCGIKKMKAGTAVDLREKGCAKLGWKPVASCSMDHDLVAVEGDLLRFGVRPADNDLCTPEKRPTSLERSQTIAFQFPPSGIPECDLLMDSYRAYLRCSSIPQDSKGYVLDYMKTGAIWQGVDANTCKQGDESMKQALQAMGC